MPRKNPLPSFPSLFEVSALATCRLVKDAVSSVARFPKVKRKDKDLKEKAVKRIDQKCAAIAEHLKSKLPLAMLTDLANMHLPKLISDPAVLMSFDCVDQTFELVYAMCVFLKCGLREFSFPRRLAKYGALVHSTAKYCTPTTRSLLHGIMTSPDFFTNLEVLNLEWLPDDGDEEHKLLRAITQHGKELSRLRLSLLKTPDSIFSCFAPRHDANGEFVGPVPFPKLVKLELLNAEGLSVLTIVDFLLSHPKLTHLEWDDLFFALLALDEKVSGMPEVFRDWKSNLTDAGTIKKSFIGNENEYLLTPGSISRLARLFPKVTVLRVDELADSEILQLIPWMQHLKELRMWLWEDEEVGRNVLTLLTTYGRDLTRIGITCSSVSVSQLVAIGQSCSNVAHFSLDVSCVTGSATNEFDDVSLFKKLETAFLLIGRYDYVHATEYRNLPAVMRIMLKDKPRLETFTLHANRNNYLTDDFICEWVRQGWAPNLREVIFDRRILVEPPFGCFQLTEAALEKLTTMPKITKIGHLKTWSVKKSTFETHRDALETAGIDLELVWEWRL